jgi:hypothetical protein
MTLSAINEGEILAEERVHTLTGYRYAVWLLSDAEGYHVLRVNLSTGTDEIEETWNYYTLHEARNGVDEMTEHIREYF